VRSGFGLPLERLFPERKGEGFSYEGIRDGTLSVEDPTEGMVSSTPRDKRPPGSWLELRNARSRGDWVGRRPGTAAIGGKPNSLPILNLVTMVNEAGNISVLRLTKDTAHLSWGAGVWNELNHDLTGEEARFSHTRMFDWLFFANGEERIRQLDIQSGTFLQVEEAPRALTVTNFGDRIVAANLREFQGGIRPNSIAWSANSDPFDWTSEGSGVEDLVQGQGGYGDPIVRLFGMGTEMIILRRRSIWHASRQAFAAAPFRFAEVVSGIGCDLPHSAVEVEGGIIFADQRTRSVYFYAPGSRPQRISQLNDREVFRDLASLTWAQGAYDPFEKEYHLGLSTSALEPWITKVWVIAVEKGAWSFDDSPMISTISITSLPENLVTIDDLVGTIDGLTGTIDELNESGVLRPQLYKGTATGEFIEQNYDHDTDWDASGFEFEAVSQNLGSPTQRRTIKDVLVKLRSEIEGSVTLEHSKAGEVWRQGKTTLLDPVLGDQDVRLPKKLTTGPKLYWRITCSSGHPRIYGWWVRVLEKGLQR
jgi:hypothetical protein